jgi:hypothetical protein
VSLNGNKIEREVMRNHFNLGTWSSMRGSYASGEHQRIIGHGDDDEPDAKESRGQQIVR